MIKNKKALTLEEAIIFGLVAFIIIFGVIPFTGRLYTAFAGERDDGSLANFQDRLIPKIHELLNNKDKLAYAEISYFIGPERAIFGYNKLWDAEKNLYILHIKLEKPNSCGNKACLCFLTSKDSASNPTRCIKFDKVKYFLRDKNLPSGTIRDETITGNEFYATPIISVKPLTNLPEIFTREEYKFFMIDGGVLRSKSQLMYIEKYENPISEVVLYFAAINDDTRDKIAKRKAYIDKVKSK